VPALLAAGVLAGCGNTIVHAPSAVRPTTRASTAAPSGAHQTAARCGSTPADRIAAEFGTGALTDVQFVSGDRGWVVGTRQILATTDGGRQWTRQDSGNLQLVSADFIGNAVGWAVGADKVLTTSDGGQHWTALPEPCPVIRSVHFVTAQVGFAIAGGGPQLTSSLAPASGGVLLASRDGGRTWHKLHAPPDPQSVCFASTRDGWLGAGGGLYRTTDGGQTWARAGAAPGHADAGYPFTMEVQCAGPDSAWALDAGSGAASSQEPHIGYYAGPSGVAPIFAEQYFPHPGITVTASSPGAYTGTLSAISPSTAAYVDNCPACGDGTAPWYLASNAGTTLTKEGNAGHITQAFAASFVTDSTGWIVGVDTNYRNPLKPRSEQNIVYTSDGGRTWQVQYSAG
jgi:Photosynthesis system II assembly factor YCF48/BNR/Asp-box repeat